MNIKAIILSILFLVSLFSISGININGIFKTNHQIEAIILQFLIALSLSYLSTMFIIEFIGL